MLNLPDRMNGYTLIAVTPVLRHTSPPRFLQDGEGIILGEDLTRRHSKWVVAHVSIGNPEMPHEWYWGYYTDDLNSAINRFLEKSELHLASIPADSF